MTEPEIQELADLRLLRSAPGLSDAQRLRLRRELLERVAACDWCTIGVMAPDAEAAWRALRSFEQAMGWPPLAAPPTTGEEVEGAVFLKGHQRSGQVWLRREEGLGQGVLVSGHSESAPAGEGTWGPLPLDFFAAP